MCTRQKKSPCRAKRRRTGTPLEKKRKKTPPSNSIRDIWTLLPIQHPAPLPFASEPLRPSYTHTHVERRGGMCLVHELIGIYFLPRRVHLLMPLFFSPFFLPSLLSLPFLCTPARISFLFSILVIHGKNWGRGTDKPNQVSLPFPSLPSPPPADSSNPIRVRHACIALRGDQVPVDAATEHQNVSQLLRIVLEYHTRLHTHHPSPLPPITRPDSSSSSSCQNNKPRFPFCSPPSFPMRHC
ncbi:hypothetical protein LY76DRAFT_381438 [Colletotrichum caudatum]|nr:hypothetical protein LY76DRAFT_381438 [Colletotrichum caudatum]